MTDLAPIRWQTRNRPADAGRGGGHGDDTACGGDLRDFPMRAPGPQAEESAGLFGAVEPGRVRRWLATRRESEA